MFRILFLIWFAFHPVHVSMTSLDYVPETNDFKVFIKMYLDDFLLDCTTNGYVVYQDSLLARDPHSLNVLEKYLGEKLLIRVNDKLLSGKLTYMDIADNDFSLNISYLNDKKPKTIAVKSLIMTDLYSDQANMLIVKVADFEEGVKLTPDFTEKIFKIN